MTSARVRGSPGASPASSTFRPASRTTWPSSRAVNLALTGTATAPVNKMPNRISMNSGPFGMKRPTRSPRATPVAVSDLATCVARSASSR